MESVALARTPAGSVVAYSFAANSRDRIADMEIAVLDQLVWAACAVVAFSPSCVSLYLLTDAFATGLSSMALHWDPIAVVIVLAEALAAVMALLMAVFQSRGSRPLQCYRRSH